MKRSPPGLIYTILVDGNPVVALEANAREAAELCREEWFRADLSTLSSDGKPLCGLGSKLQARPATEDERSEYAEGSKEADASDEILGSSRWYVKKLRDFTVRSCRAIGCRFSS